MRIPALRRNKQKLVPIFLLYKEHAYRFEKNGMRALNFYFVCRQTVIIFYNASLLLPTMWSCHTICYLHWAWTMSSASPKRWKWTISRSLKYAITRFTSGSFDTLKMLSYVVLAFCSAAIMYRQLFKRKNGQTFRCAKTEKHRYDTLCGVFFAANGC